MNVDVLVGASVDVVASNSSPSISISQPDGNQDVANTYFQIEYNAIDSDDDIGSGLRISLYAYPASSLNSVQDVRVFATLIADVDIRKSDRTAVVVVIFCVIYLDDASRLPTPVHGSALLR